MRSPRRDQALADASGPAAAGKEERPAHQEIAALAYTYWEARGYQGGSATDDWLRAEAELLRRLA